MSMTHAAIAQIFTDRLAPAGFREPENSVERGRRAELEAWSLTRLVGRLMTWARSPAAVDPQAELEAAVTRLSELSPHLLIDVGINPATGDIAGEGVVLVAPRPIRSPEPATGPEALPVPVVRAQRPARLLLQVRVLPSAGAKAVVPAV